MNRDKKLRIAAHVMILARTTARLWNQVDLRQTTLNNAHCRSLVYLSHRVGIVPGFLSSHPNWFPLPWYTLLLKVTV